MLTKSLAAAAAVTIAFAGQAFAWGDTYMGHSTAPQGPQIHAYGGPNYCPAGLQPVVLNGVICCGTPNSSMSYSQMMAHPMPKKAKRAHARHVQRYRAVPGVKGVQNW